MNLKRAVPFLALFGLAVLGLALAIATPARPAQAAPPAQEDQPGIPNSYCLSCHGLPDQQITLPSGEILYLTVDEQVYHESVHGAAGYACIQCHTDIREYPHPPLAATTRREVTLSMYQSCAHCHQSMYEKTLDSVHQEALAAGNENAAVCTDCHGAHNVQDPAEPRTRIPQTCERCHSQIYQLYADSVHGSALIGEGNPDVPTCIDCHGVHNVAGPVDAEFHLFSPEICAKCHTDPELMGRYGISTNVLNSYVSDFHGTTVVLFEAVAPGQETNKPVCVDCHGIHDILPADDPNSAVIKENLLNTCQRCHPEASVNFSGAWLSHYEPSPQHYPVVYFVDLFYKIFIPTVLGGMALFVATDAGRRISARLKERGHERNEDA